MSDFLNPFSQLKIREYNITNLKKILNIFPTQLKVEELTSNQLLDKLRSIIKDRDITIEELLAQLANRQNASDQLTGINDKLSGLADDLNLGEIVQQTSKDSAQQARIQSLLSQGYVQIGNTPLYVLVESSPTSNIKFNINHTDENAGFPESDLKSPSSLKFVNVSKTNDVWFMKFEDWKSNLDGISIPNDPTNAFRLVQFTDAHKRAYKIPKDSDVSTSVRLYYKSKGDYKDAGLKRSGETNEWSGFMKIRAKIDNSDGIHDIKGTDIGNMRLYRDRN